MPVFLNSLINFSWFFSPGESSTPLFTSTADGFTASTPFKTLEAVNPPERIIGVSILMLEINPQSN